MSEILVPPECCTTAGWAVLQSYFGCGESTARFNKTGEDSSQQTSKEGIDGEEPG